MPDVFDPRVFAKGVPHDALRLLGDTASVSWQEVRPTGVGAAHLAPRGTTSHPAGAV